MAPLTRAQMTRLAEDAMRTFQDWLTAIPRVILNKVGVELFNPLWQLRRFSIGKLGQTNKANLQILNERRRNIISRFETLVGKTNEQVRQDRWEKAVQNRNTLIRNDHSQTASLTRKTSNAASIRIYILRYLQN